MHKPPCLDVRFPYEGHLGEYVGRYSHHPPLTRPGQLRPRPWVSLSVLDKDFRQCPQYHHDINAPKMLQYSKILILPSLLVQNKRHFTFYPYCLGQSISINKAMKMLTKNSIEKVGSRLVFTVTKTRL